MTGHVIAALAIIVIAGYLIARAGQWLSAQWFLVRTWRFLSGSTWHGRPVTDAGWLRPGVKALTPTGHASRYWHRPRLHRAGIRSGSVLAAAVAVWAWLVNRQATVMALGVIVVAVVALAAVRAGRWLAGRKERRTWLLPLHLGAHELAGHPRAALAASWITVRTDQDGAVTWARLALPQGWPADPKHRDQLVQIASTKLGIEAPEVRLALSGPNPALEIAKSLPPPRTVAFADIAEAVAAARADELVIGVGKQGALVKASLTGDSPHIGISMGSGGGKSNLAAFMLMQELRRGAIALVLDAKWISHPWLIGLPNVAYARTAAQLHAAMAWLSDELDRRNQVALRSVDVRGVVRANVGPRLFIVAEELNLAIPRLRAFWDEARDHGDPKRSPALTGLGEVAFAGRQVKMHMVLIGQMLTASATGSRDSSVKENVGIKCMARYSPKNWAVMAPEHPMPAKPSIVGRIQLVTAAGVRETQVPLIDPAHARQFVIAGDVTPCPAGMPGSTQVTVTAAAALEPGPDVHGVTVTPLTGPPIRLSEAVAIGLLPMTLTAARMARHRDPAFPPPVGQDGLAHLYDPIELDAWQKAR